MKQSDTLHRSDIKTGKSRCALYTHIGDNETMTLIGKRKLYWLKKFSSRGGKLKKQYTSTHLIMEP
jgi:hypothetical protein